MNRTILAEYDAIREDRPKWQSRLAGQQCIAADTAPWLED